jgi:hypothetical protein
VRDAEAHDVWIRNPQKAHRLRVVAKYQRSLICSITRIKESFFGKA